jgi:hypothetical protein
MLKRDRADPAQLIQAAAAIRIKARRRRNPAMEQQRAKQLRTVA